MSFYLEYAISESYDNLLLAFFKVFAVPDKKESEAVQLLRIIWKNVAKLPKGEIDDILRGPPVTITLKDGKKTRGYHSRVLFVATKMGNTRFIVELIRLYPDLIWKKDDKGKTIFHLAIKCRQAKIYNLLYEIGAMKEIITPITDRKGNNMLHMAAYKANRRKIHNGSGVAFEIQRELLWFKEVEQMIPPTYRQRKNEAGETPQDMFVRKQADLVSNGKDWLNHYMLVATLIATIVFAAAFTLPGGYNQNTGVPFFQQEPSLIIFVISDSVSLISSSTSVLIFFIHPYISLCGA
ncbi:putative ankyrin repeat-containing domain, PGG domain, ankyrin repeat-containing domain superfamily [Helianthus annuus]|nr:putative ankyrin repeat-containing domain, PGG domain, ankyrin repeat-containing domain superfamily [Helianthus annuus]